MKTIIMILILAFGLAEQINAGDIPNGCDFITPDYLNDLAGFGDSRAASVDNYFEQGNIENEIPERGNNPISIAINPPNLNGKRILGLNLHVLSRSFPGSTTFDWYTKMQNCGTYQMPTHTFISLGGNDLINILVEKELLMMEYQTLQFKKAVEDLGKVVELLLTRKVSAARKLTLRNVVNQGLQRITQLIDKFKALIKNPGKYIARCTERSLLNGAPVIGNFLQLASGAQLIGDCDPPLLSFHNYWQWRTDVKMDMITKNMEFIARHILRQSPGHHIMLNTIAPPAIMLYPEGTPSSSNIPTNPDSIAKGLAIAKNYPDALKLFFGLNLKYFTNVLMHLWVNYPPPKVIFVESAQPFASNIANKRASFYVLDGIHYSNEGKLFWGRIMAETMVQWGWYPAGPGFRLPPDPKFYSDTNVNMHHTSTMVKALDDNAPVNSVLTRELGFQEASFKKEFPEIQGNYYSRHGDPYVIPLRGNMLHKYRQMDEANGQLGAPMTEEFCWGPIPTCPTRIAFFEKGFILDDVLGGTNAVVNVYDAPVATQSASPDFDTCTTGCSARWFEFYIIQLQPKSGMPPYSWNLVGGSLPDGAVLQDNGTLRGSPTNNATGTWHAKVRLTDGRGLFIERQITFSSGL